MSPEHTNPSPVGRPIIRGSRVWLRAFERADLEAYKAAINDADVAYWAGYRAPQSSENVLDWYEGRVRAQHGKDGYFFVISPLGSKEFTGTIWLWNLDSRMGGGELSIFVADSSEWGAGIGTDAVSALVDFAFGFLTIGRIWLFTSAENERASRSFAKAGFVQEGRIRGHYMRRGRLLDSLQMSMLRSDWEALGRPRSWEDGASTDLKME